MVVLVEKGRQSMRSVRVRKCDDRVGKGQLELFKLHRYDVVARTFGVR